MVDNKNAGLFLVYDLILLIAFIGLIILVFNFGGLLLLGELTLISILLLLSFIAVIAVYVGARWSYGLLFFIFAVILIDMLFMYFKFRTINAVYFITLLVSVIGFIMSIASIKREEEFEEFEPTPKEDEEEATTTYTPGKFVASKTASNYHKPKCDWARKIKKSNQVWFSSEKEANDKGYKPHSCLK